MIRRKKAVERQQKEGSPQNSHEQTEEGGLERRDAFVPYPSRNFLNSRPSPQASERHQVANGNTRRNGLTGTTLGTEISEHGDGLLALLDFALFHSLDEGVFSIERPGLPSEFQSLFPSNFSDGATRSQVALQDPMSSESAGIKKSIHMNRRGNARVWSIGEDRTGPATLYESG